MARKNGIVSLALLATFVSTSAILHSDEKQAVVTYSIGIKGMTCEQCVAPVQKELTAVPGVMKASVDYKSGHAWVTVEALRNPVPPAKPRRIGTDLAAAVERAGVNHGDGFKPTVNYVLTVKGMTCEGCSQHIQEALVDVPGVAGASVSYKGGYAVVVPKAESGDLSRSLVLAVESSGYHTVVHTRP